jgi:hypothetical protein
MTVRIATGVVIVWSLYSLHRAMMAFLASAIHVNL